MLDPRNLFAAVGADAPVIVAVSGGSDSIALLHLASTWAKAVGANLHVVSVDHGLRPEAAAEAAFVAGVSEGLGHSHFTLAWNGVKPSSGISQAARHARYMLMAEFARDVGACTIVTGHTLDDQAETIWMRNSRDGNSPQHRGLAGMARCISLEPEIEVIRPLLGMRRQPLRQYLSDIGQTWIEDPSNHDETYERVRARNALRHSPIGVEEIGRFAALAGRWRRIDCDAVAVFLKDHLIVAEGPVYKIGLDQLQKLPPQVARLVVQVVMALAGGREHFLTWEHADQVLRLEANSRRTARYAVAENKRDNLLFYRENRNLPMLSLESGDSAVWDGRLLVENRSKSTIVCRALDASEPDDLDENVAGAVQPRSAIRAMPVIQDMQGGRIRPFVRQCKVIPGVTWRLTSPVLETFSPDYDRPLREVLDFVQKEIEPASL